MRIFVILLILIGMGRNMFLPASSTSKIWAYGVPLTGLDVGGTNDGGEPSVIYEAGAQVLTGTVYKMWYGGGTGGTPEIWYAESNDGIAWTRYGSNPLLSGYHRPSVYKDGSTYKLYAVPSATNIQIDYYTSTDGLAWTLDTAAALALGAGGQWDDGMFGNNFVWKEGTNDYRMIYEARSGSGAWHLGYATSTDGKTWSKSGSNPVVNETGSTGGPFVYKAGTNDYWMWVHRSQTGTLPCDISKYHSTNLTTWTRTPAHDTLTRSSADEGNNNSVGQLSDIFLMTVGNQTYAWLPTIPDGTTGHSHVKLFVARLPMNQLIYTEEGF